MQYAEPFQYERLYDIFIIEKARDMINNNYENVLNVIRETVNHYRIGNRSVSESSCEYKNVNGYRCAIGRCLTEEALEDFHSTELISPFAIDMLPRHIAVKYSDFDSMFQEKYQGVDELVWKHLQMLHDNCVYWDENGLSAKGKARILAVFGTRIYKDIFPEEEV